MDRIEPIRPRPPSAQPIPSIRRNDSSTEKRDRDGREPRKRRSRPAAVPPPDDGLPHIDVRV